MSEQNQNARSAFTVWEILLVVFLLGFIALMIIPGLLVRSKPSAANICLNNLRIIDGGANQFALEHQLTNGDRIKFPEDLIPYLSHDGKWTMPVCPKGGVYSIRKIGGYPTCSVGTNDSPAHILY